METDIREMQAEIERLKIEIASTPRVSPVHTAMKDVTLVSGFKAWTGDNRSRTVHEIFAQIDTYSKVSNKGGGRKSINNKGKFTVHCSAVRAGKRRFIQ